jgi:hypothetical protein
LEGEKIFVRVVGVDLAGVESRPTGVCLLIDCTARTMVLYRDAELTGFVREQGPRVVAIDAPLSLPRGRRSLSQRGKPHLRECDRQLLRMRIRFFPITLGPMRKLTSRGMKLKQGLERMGFEVIEVYPGAAQDLWGIPRARDRKGLLSGLRKLGVKGLRKGMSSHELDAVTSALVGKLYLEGRYEAIGDASEGLIILPKI